MTKFKTGFIGCGNMATAIINGIINQNILAPEDLYLFDTDKEKLEQFECANKSSSIEELAKSAEVIFLCVKPNIIESVCHEVKTANRAFISIAAGVKLEKISLCLPKDSRVMRIMPNTPMLVGKGAISIQIPNNLTTDEQNFVYNILQSLGKIAEVGKNNMDAVTGVSGSGPAYVYMFIDAVATAGEKNGLDRSTALDLAIETFEGACVMLKSTGKTPSELIKDVCSPGGTTLEAMRVFEDHNICDTISAAVDACVKRSKELSK